MSLSVAGQHLRCSGRCGCQWYSQSQFGRWQCSTRKIKEVIRAHKKGLKPFINQLIPDNSYQRFTQFLEHFRQHLFGYLATGETSSKHLAIFEVNMT